MGVYYSVSDKTRGGRNARLFPFEKIKDTVLGKSYDLSLTFVGQTASRRLNLTHRKKNKPTNVLSFPLSKTSGEIIITPSVADKQAEKFGLSKRQFIGKLFIHGLLHLKGFEHGSRMDEEESRLLKRFKIIA